MDTSDVASLDEAVSNMENAGYTVTHNKANKTIIAKQNFTSEVLEEMLSFMKLNSSKTKVKLTLGRNSLEYTKQ